MAGESIDSLTVDIGLSTEEFQAGIQRVLDSMGRMQTTATETGSSMSESFAAAGASIGGLVLKFAGLFLAVRGIEDVVGYFKDLHVELANLGFASEYLGQSGVALSRFGEVARLAGGNAQDAISAVQSLQASIFGLEFQGQMSQNLLMLQRLGVAYLDTAGHMKPLKDIAMGAAAALQQQLPGKANEAMRVQWAATIFGAGGLANAVGGGLAQLRAFYSESTKDQKNITQRLIDSQEQMSRKLTDNTYAIENEAARALNHLTPEIDKLIDVIRDQLIPTLDELITGIFDWMHPDQMLNAAANKPLDMSSPTSAIAHFIKWFSGFEMAHLHIGNPELAHMQVPGSVLARLSSSTNLDVLKMEHLVAGGDEGDPTWSKAVIAYQGLYVGAKSASSAEADYARAVAEGRGGVIARPHHVSPHALATPGAPRPRAAPAGSAASKPTASVTGPRVTIGTIGPIYTQATDANGLVADINRATQRKLLVGRSDPGLA